MKSMLGCLFIIIFGGILLFIGLIRLFAQMLFGKGLSGTNKGPFGSYGSFGGFNTNSNNSRQPNTDSSSRHTTHAGNAHHEGNPNSRQKRSGKIFEKNEGEYVDFEEIH